MASHDGPVTEDHRPPVFLSIVPGEGMGNMSRMIRTLNVDASSGDDTWNMLASMPLRVRMPMVLTWKW
jgi:hypothetical protein